MKLLAATSSFPTATSPTAGSFIAQWRSNLEARGHDIDVFRSDHTNGKATDPLFQRWGPLLKGNGAPEYLDDRTLQNIYAISVQTARIYWDYSQVPKPHDLTVGHWLLPWGLLPKGGGALHLYAHGSDVSLLERLPKRLSRSMARQIVKNTQGITFVSQDLSDRFKALLDAEWGCERTVLPMGVQRSLPDQDYFDHLVATEPNTFTITTLGRLVPIKGIDTLIRALKGISGCRLLVTGDGPEKAHLVRLAKQLGVNTRFLGHVNAAQRESVMCHTNLFVQPSRVLNGRQEGCPVSLLEALDAGVPALMSATGGMREISAKTGLMCIEPNRVATLRDAIKRHLSDKVFRQEQTRMAEQQLNQWAWSSVIDHHEKALLASCAPTAQPQE